MARPKTALVTPYVHSVIIGSDRAKRKIPNPIGKLLKNKRRPQEVRGHAEPGLGRRPAPVAAKRRHDREKAGDARTDGALWLYGQHAVIEALKNPARRKDRLVASPESQHRPGLAAALDAAKPALALETLTRHEIDALLPEGAVHQGLALRCSPLAQPSLGAFVASLAKPTERARLVVALDQVTDPHNVGAVMRSAAAFGADGLITLRHNAPSESGVLAKAASGALEHLPYLQLANLTNAMKDLQKIDFWSIGLAADGDQDLAALPACRRALLVLGSEGQGLRRLTRERCDFLARLPTSGPLPQLNVSNAAAIALYELIGRQSR